MGIKSFGRNNLHASPRFYLRSKLLYEKRAHSGGVLLQAPGVQYGAHTSPRIFEIPEFRVGGDTPSTHQIPDVSGRKYIGRKCDKNRERSRKGKINLSVTCTFFLKLFLALAIPLEDPYKSVSIAQFFEATYNLPTNASEEHLWLDAGDDNRKRRSLDRATLYPVVESKFDK